MAFVWIVLGTEESSKLWMVTKMMLRPTGKMHSQYALFGLDTVNNLLMADRSQGRPVLND
jgi:hypothetical protein